MTKIKWDDIPECSSEKLYDTLINHSYYGVGVQCVEKRRNKSRNILHLILEYYEISKADNKMNKKRKPK